MAPHYIFWPFDAPPSPEQKARVRALTHIADSLRMGVLAQEEGAELRWEGHVMECPRCHDPAMSLWEQMPRAEDPPACAQQVSCAETRNGLFRYLEQGRTLEPGVLSHLVSCLSCNDHFVEPAKALYRLEIDEDSVSAQD